MSPPPALPAPSTSAPKFPCSLSGPSPRRRRLGAKPYERQYLTTHKNYFVRHSGLPVGFVNQGIMSQKSQYTHWTQSL